MKISIIIPFYNVKAELVTRCVQSIKKQSFEDWEIIIVNDGSDKIYSDVLESVLKTDQRIKVINQKNSGVSCARNTGIIHAKGEFVFFVDADDMLAPGALDHAIRAQEITQSDLIIGATEKQNSYKEVITTGLPRIEILDKGKIKQYRKYFIGGHKYGFESGGYLGRGPWARLVSKELAKETSFDISLSQGEDIVWNLQLLNKCEKACFVDSIWYLYYSGNPNSATHRYNENIYNNILHEMQTISDLIDFDDNDVFVAFCEKAIDELCKVSNCLLDHKDCTLNKEQRKTIIRDVYTNSLWKCSVGSKRYRGLARGKNKIKKVLYDLKILMKYYSVRPKN